MDPIFIVAIVITCVVILIKLIFLIIMIVTDSDLTLFWCRIFGSRISSLRGKVVWISGASTGLGEAIAIQLAKVGAKIVITGNDNTHDEVKRRCLEVSEGKLNDDDILAIPPFDIRDVTKHESVVNKVLAHFKHIDILINNVGITQRCNFDAIPHDVEKSIMDINYFGQINLTKEVCKHFKEKRKGHLAVTISVCGKFPCPFSASYDASKFALMGYYDCIRNELPWLTVTLVCPGPIFTQNISKAHMAGDFEKSKRSYDQSDKRMKVERAAFLYCVALANKLDEVWFSLKPILFLFYGAQYFPSTFRKLWKMFASPEKVIAMREGRKENNNKEVV